MYNERGNRALGKWLLACFAALTAGTAQGQTPSAPPSSYPANSPEIAGTAEDGDERFRSLFRSWAAVESMASANPTTASTASAAAPRYAAPAPRAYSPPAYLSPPPAPAAQPRYGCSESGSCYGDISPATGRSKTVYVPGYFKSNGKYVRGYYRSN